MDNNQIILAIAIGIAMAIFTTVKMYREKKYSTKVLVITFVLSVVIVAAVWIGMNYALKAIFPR